MKACILRLPVQRGMLLEPLDHSTVTSEQQSRCELAALEAFDVFFFVRGERQPGLHDIPCVRPKICRCRPVSLAQERVQVLLNIFLSEPIQPGERPYFVSGCGRVPARAMKILRDFASRRAVSSRGGKRAISKRSRGAERSSNGSSLPAEARPGTSPGRYRCVVVWRPHGTSPRWRGNTVKEVDINLDAALPAQNGTILEI